MEQKARLQSENKKNEIAENDDVEQDINKLHKERVREGGGGGREKREEEEEKDSRSATVQVKPCR